MSASIPEAMKAVIIENGKAAVKQDIPIPELEEGFVLIKTVVVAGNPTDWKHIDYKIGPQGSLLGCDVAGQIVKLGPGVDSKHFAIGDYIYGFVHGASVRFPSNGAFAEFSAISSETAYRPAKEWRLCGKDSLPEGPVKSLEGAVSLPVSLTTARYDPDLSFWSGLEVGALHSTKGPAHFVMGRCHRRGATADPVGQKTELFQQDHRRRFPEARKAIERVRC